MTRVKADELIGVHDRCWDGDGLKALMYTRLPKRQAVGTSHGS